MFLKAVAEETRGWCCMMLFLGCNLGIRVRFSKRGNTPVVTGQTAIPKIAPGLPPKFGPIPDVIRQRVTLTRAGRHLLPPLVVFLVPILFLWKATAAAEESFMTWSTWARWDSGLYINIAQHGYQFFACRGGGPCGNTAWFPVYPWLIAVGMRLGFAPDQIGVILSWAFDFGILLLIWIGYLHSESNLRNWLILILAAFWFGNIFDRTVYPLSMASFLMLLSLLTLYRGHYLIAACIAGIAAATYSSAFLAAVPLGIAAVFPDRAGTLVQRFRNGLVAGAVVIAGLALVVMIQRFATGIWGPSFLVEAKYTKGFHDPFATLVEAITSEHRDWLAPHLQALVVALAVVASVAATPWFWRHRMWFEMVVACYVAVFWLVPLVGGSGVSLYRSDAMLLPIVLLGRRLPWYALVPFVLAAVILTYPMAYLFFKGRLV